MLIQTECLSCLLRQLVRLIKIADIPEHREVGIAKEVLRELFKEDIELLTPPAAGRVFNTIFNRLSGIDDPYKDIKKYSNDIAMKILQKERGAEWVKRAPLAAAIKFAIAGNVIDYGAQHNLEDDDIIKTFDVLSSSTIDDDSLAVFREDFAGAGKILMVGDNAGEIVFDRFLIENLPADKITYSVRGGPVINDSTRDDAGYVGLSSIVRVIDTGDNTPGVEFARCGREFLNEFSEADMIILKGQGNFETVYDADVSPYKKKDTPMYFLFKVKCPPAARVVGCGEGEYKFLRRL